MDAMNWLEGEQRIRLRESTTLELKHVSNTYVVYGVVLIYLFRDAIVVTCSRCVSDLFMCLLEQIYIFNVMY